MPRLQMDLVDLAVVFLYVYCVGFMFFTRMKVALDERLL